jgi:focal adhesion kinase 1
MISYIVCLMMYFTANDYEIQRDKIKLLDILGNGQFGDVHKGVYREKVK